VTRPRFKKFLRWLIGILAFLILLLVVAIVFRNSILKTVTCWNVKSSTGLKANIRKFDLDFGRSELAIADFRIWNSPAFGNSALLDIPEIYFALAPEAATSGKIRFKEVRFNLREVNVVQNTNGVTNLELLQKALETNISKSVHLHLKTMEFGGVDKLVVSLGKVNFTDLANPANNTQIDLGVKEEVAKNLKSEEELQNWTTALLLRLTIQQSLSGGSRASGTKALEKLMQKMK